MFFPTQFSRPGVSLGEGARPELSDHMLKDIGLPLRADVARSRKVLDLKLTSEITKSLLLIPTERKF